MAIHAFELWLILGLTLFFLTQLRELGRFARWTPAAKTGRRHPRPLRPRTPNDCLQCRGAVSNPTTPAARTVIPYSQQKSPRGRKKALGTQGYACPNPDCLYFQVTDASLHALVGYGHHGRIEPIQDLYCLACHRKFTARRDTTV